MNRPWMPLYVADYLADTAHLNAAEHGAYLLLLMHYWANGGLPQDEQQLARIARMTARQWSSARDHLRSFFGDMWRHKRVDDELAKAAGISAKRRAAGSQKGSKPEAIADQLQTHSQSQRKKDAAGAAPELPLADSPPPKLRVVEDSLDNPEKALFERGKQVLGQNAAGLIVKIRNSQGGNIALARAMIERASTKQNPREWVNRALVGPANEVDAREEAKLIEAWKTKHKRAVVFDTDRPGAIAEMLADRARASL